MTLIKDNAFVCKYKKDVKINLFVKTKVVVLFSHKDWNLIKILRPL